jgi:hypothetical protein
MLGIVDDIARALPRRLTAIKGRLRRPHRFANPVLGRRSHSDLAFAAGMIHGLEIDLHVPKMVADEFILESGERVGGISGIAPVNSAPIDQLCPTCTTAAASV